MGITENYRFTKRKCVVCDHGVVEVPVGVDPLDYCRGESVATNTTEVVEEVCPVCDGKGWYYYEEED